MKRSGFTLVEVVMVIVILGILAAVAIPTFFNLQDDAKESACKGALGGLRSGISIWYAKEAAAGTADWPTAAELTCTTAGAGVMAQGIPCNPYCADATCEDVVEGSAGAEGTPQGWTYCVTTGGIWANCDAACTGF